MNIEPDKTGGNPDTSDSNTDEVVEISQALDRCYTLLGRQFGPLSRPQRRMLGLLSRETPVRVGDLGEQLGLTTAGTTRMLDKLESLEYAVRSRATHSDQRQVYVMLTPAGEQALGEAEAVFLSRVRTMLGRLSATERVALVHILQRLNYSVDAQASTANSPFGRPIDGGRDGLKCAPLRSAEAPYEEE
jgi:DNA-binding MarR family transcriptional regulator